MREGGVGEMGKYEGGMRRKKEEGREGGTAGGREGLTTAATHSLMRCLSHRDWRRSWMRAASV